jgi:hypothetical protein
VDIASGLAAVSEISLLVFAAQISIGQVYVRDALHPMTVFGR